MPVGRSARPKHKTGTANSGAQRSPPKRSNEAQARATPPLIRAARAWMGGLTAVQIMVTASISDAFKSAVASTIPPAATLATFSRLHPTATAMALGIGITATLASLLIVWRYDPKKIRDTGGPATLSWINSPRFAYGSMTVATASTLALIALIGVLMVRPTWCPETVCPPTLASVSGPHDSYVAADVIAIESGTWVISADPASYSLAHLPPSGSRAAVVAARIAPNQAAPADSPYRVVVNVHSLRADHGDISIESVSLVVGKVSRPGRTNVWRKPIPADYTNNPFKAVYAGQTAASFIEARFSGTPAFGHVSLKPGETDVLSITVSSNVSADVTFQVRVEYRYVGESSTHVFVVPYNLEAIFVEPLDWYEYQLRNGKLEPA